MASCPGPLQQRALAILVLVLLAPHAAHATRARASARMHADSDGPSDDAEPDLDKGVSDRSAGRLQAVINTLQDISQSITNEEKTETANYGTYKKWCKDELARIDLDLGQKEPALRGADVSEAEKTAAISSTAHAIATAEKTHGETVQMIAQAKKVRDEEADKYNEDMLLNQQSVSQVDQAITAVDKLQVRGGFLQDGHMKRLQVNEPGESSIVLGTIKQLKAHLLETAKAIMTSEDEKVRMYGVIVDSKQGQTMLLENDIIDKKEQISGLKVENLDNKRAQKRIPAEIADLQTSKAEVESACNAKAKAWDVRQGDREKEKKSLKMAIDYLTSNAKTIDQSPASSDDAAPSFLEERSVASDVNKQMSQDSYGGAKKAIKELSGVLESQQAKEAEMKKRCDTELAQTDAEKSDTDDTIEGLEALIQSKASEALDIQREVDGIDSEIKSMNAAVKAAKEIRGKEQAAYESGSKDRKLAIKVLKQANNVLRMFYKSADRTGLLAKKIGSKGKADPQQVGAKSAPKTWTASSRKDTSSNAAIGMIQDLIADVQAEQTNADADEQKAADDFAEFQTNSQKQFDENMAEYTNRAKRKAQLLVQENGHADDHDGKEDELKGINEKLTALHAECDELLQFYDQRTKARRDQVDQLRDAFDILSGSSVAVRTGLMQEVAAVMAAGQQLH